MRWIRVLVIVSFLLASCAADDAAVAEDRNRASLTDQATPSSTSTSVPPTTVTTTIAPATTTSTLASTITAATSTTTLVAPTTTTVPRPTTTSTTKPATTTSTQGCHPSYVPCLKIVSDYDCIGGSGNGPLYTGRVQVIGPDDYDLDRDGDGIGCDKS